MQKQKGTRKEKKGEYIGNEKSRPKHMYCW